ncbi:zinc finger 862-like, partial [Paramuricea clavata]
YKLNLLASNACIPSLKMMMNVCMKLQRMNAGQNLPYLIICSMHETASEIFILCELTKTPPAPPLCISKCAQFEINYIVVYLQRASSHLSFSFDYASLNQVHSIRLLLRDNPCKKYREKMSFEKVCMSCGNNTFYSCIKKTVPKQNQSTIKDFFAKKPSNSNVITAPDPDQPSTSKTTPSVATKRPLSNNQTEGEVTSKKPKIVTSHFYGVTEEECCLQLAKLIETAFLNHFQGDILPEHIHNYYICKLRNCTDISEEDKTKMKKDNKFQHKWLTDVDIAYCKETGIWTGTVKGHLLQASKGSTTLHGKIAASLEKSKYSSYFVTTQKERENYINSSYLAVFKALYWLAKEEVANAKTVSLLGLLEELGVKEVGAFTTRSESVLRKMVILIANTITEKIVNKIKKSEAFGLLTDEVTDISNVQQLVSFIQFFDDEIGDCVTKFIETADLLESSPNSSPDADAIFSCLVKLLQKHGLDLNELKGFGSDGASVMTGRNRGVAAKFKSLEECKTMINIHCVCHRLALACADTDDELKFIQDFEKTALELWSFFKKSPKRLKIYIKVTLGVRNFDAMSKRQKKKLVRKVKKAVRTRWLSLNASVDSISQEYVGLVHALRSMQEDRNSGSTAKGLLKKIDSVQFLGTLYLLKFVLPHLSALSHTIQA